jgi:hypothetical protein
MERLADIDMGQITANDTELAGVYCYWWFWTGWIYWREDPTLQNNGKEPATNFSFYKDLKSLKQAIGTFSATLETLYPKLTDHFLRYTNSKRVLGLMVDKWCRPKFNFVACAWESLARSIPKFDPSIAKFNKLQICTAVQIHCLFLSPSAHLFRLL